MNSVVMNSILLGLIWFLCRVFNNYNSHKYRYISQCPICHAPATRGQKCHGCRRLIPAKRIVARYVSLGLSISLMAAIWIDIELVQQFYLWREIGSACCAIIFIWAFNTAALEDNENTFITARPLYTMLLSSAVYALLRYGISTRVIVAGLMIVSIWIFIKVVKRKLKKQSQQQSTVTDEEQAREAARQSDYKDWFSDPVVSELNLTPLLLMDYANECEQTTEYETPQIGLADFALLVSLFLFAGAVVGTVILAVSLVVHWSISIILIARGYNMINRPGSVYELFPYTAIAMGIIYFIMLHSCLYADSQWITLVSLI